MSGGESGVTEEKFKPGWFGRKKFQSPFGVKRTTVELGDGDRFNRDFETRFYSDPPNLKDAPKEAPDIAFARKILETSDTRHQTEKYDNSKNSEDSRLPTGRELAEIAKLRSMWEKAPKEDKERIKDAIDAVKAGFDREVAKKVFAKNAPKYSRKDFDKELPQSNANMKRAKELGVEEVDPERDRITHFRNLYNRIFSGGK